MSARLARAAPPPARCAEEPPVPRTRATSLSAWLLGPHVQIALGVARRRGRRMDRRRGDATYVYPEITGYYLQWLAWHAAAATA